MASSIPEPHDQGVFARGIGADFGRLHPQMQRRFGVGVGVGVRVGVGVQVPTGNDTVTENADPAGENRGTGYACVGRGIMREIRTGPWWVRPFLLFGATRNIMFPESGRDVPFQIDNYPYIDSYGRETVTFVRTMEVGRGKRRRFDATMIYSDTNGRVIDYLGTHQHLAVDLELTVTERGGLRLVSGAQRFYEGWIGFTFPAFLTGRAYLDEFYDDERECYVIDMEVRHALFGLLFGYRGEFTCEFPEVDPVCAPVPVSLKPYREELRE